MYIQFIDNGSNISENTAWKYNMINDKGSKIYGKK